MRRTLYLVAALAVVLSGCTQIGNKLNPKDPVNNLRPTMPVGASTKADSNPLLVPPSYPKQPVTPAK